MTKITMRSALALPLLLAAQGALADETAAQTEAEIVALGLRPDAHGPAGTMADHVHRSGDFMFALMWMHEDYGGANRTGTAALGDAEVASAGYSAKADAMTMDMAMLHLMYAPSDRVTLMLSPSWMRMGMTMKGLPGADDDHGGHGGHHALLPGETMHHSAQGTGDTQFGAVVALSRRPALSVLAGLMVSAPTGKVIRKNADGSYLHYMMQGGSGTWDLNPSLTLRGSGQGFSWGVQTAYLFRAEKANAAGFRFGDRFTATGWLAKPLSPRFSLSARALYSAEGAISGHYNGPHSHAAPVDRQRNYGGRRLELGLGGNLVVGERLRLGAEATVPVYQQVNGIQVTKRFGANLNASVMF